MYNLVEKTIDLGDGRVITIETGKLAKQADGSVVVRMGRTMLLATVVSAKEAKENVDFMPLSVEYKEKFANPYVAAAKGYVDAVIEPEETRDMLTHAIDVSINKEIYLPRKKHGIPPF